MKTIGIITIHKINNYGSVFQAFALQKVCEDMGNNVEIIDYNFPNEYHEKHCYPVKCDTQPNEPLWIKMLYAPALIRQHKGIHKFVNKYQHLSKNQYNSPDELLENVPEYDVYITGSDQLWNPRYCGGDPVFILNFAPDDAKKISYAASIGVDALPVELIKSYRTFLSRYQYISVREQSSIKIIQSLIDKKVYNVLDPTLLLTRDQWNVIACKKRIVKKKYILCYFLNYSFNAFPYVDKLADYFQKQTGYELVHVARPPHHLRIPYNRYLIGASPEEFLALVRDAEMVLTTSFHGTAFAVNYGKPVFTVVKDKTFSDSRQVCLMHNLGIEDQILQINDAMPDENRFHYDEAVEQGRLAILRKNSMDYLKMALSDELSVIM